MIVPSKTEESEGFGRAFPDLLLILGVSAKSQQHEQEFIRKDRQKELLYYVNLIRAYKKVLYQTVYIEGDAQNLPQA